MIDEIFRQVARSQPGKLAVRSWDGELTYAELDRRAGLLAGRLKDAGARSGSVIGVDLERSATAIVALVAILRLGAAYVALDPRQPTGHRRLVLADARARLVLTRTPGAPGLPPGCQAITPDGIAGSGIRGGVAVGPEHLAYLAYTSGSTGRPKGVCVPHRAVVRLVAGNDYLPVRGDDVFVQYAPLAFDASTLEVWAPLLTGASLAIPPPGDPTPAGLGSFVRSAGVTVLWLTAGLFHRVVEAGLDDLKGLRYLLAGGDVLSVAHVNRALAALSGCVLINGYGPTENTTFTCCHAMTSAVRGATVPIGRPIRGSTAYLLDEALRPVPPGAAGELYTGGLGVAQGYAGDPALTAERFLPDPFSAAPGARMYRTGDLVRQRDGGLEFLGRADSQVKIRGFRVELGAVEAALVSIPGVAEAAVVTQRDRSGSLRMRAFLSGTKSAPDVRRELMAILPEYSVPAFIDVLDALPLTANGKVDRAGLAARQVRARPELKSAYRAPATTLERAVTQMWTDLLDLDEIGADDDFFEIGGHSLLGVHILGELNREHGVAVSPLAFYHDPTPAGLARAIAQFPAAGCKRPAELSEEARP